MRLLKNKRGDTIAEVMISIAIIGMVIAMSYATTTRTVSDNTSAAEHTQALGYAQAQIEQLANYLSSADPTDPNLSTIYGAGLHCLSTSSARGTVVNTIGSSISDPHPLFASCQGGGPNDGSWHYQYGFEYKGGGTGHFNVYVIWPNPTSGSNNAEVELSYVYQRPS